MASAFDPRESIVAQYRDFGLKDGWSYLYSPESHVAQARLLTVGLNPGGGGDDAPWTEEWSAEDGWNAYVCQEWSGGGIAGTRLQQQMRLLFDLLPYRHEHILSLQYVPLRSPNWASLPRKAEALALAAELFRWVLASARPELVIGIGKSVLRDQLPALLGARRIADAVRVEWGRQTAELWRFGATGRLVLLPHLSRYAIFGRGNDAILKERLFGAVPVDLPQ